MNSRFEGRLTAPSTFTDSPLTLKFWPWESNHVFRFMFNFIADTKFYWKINLFLCPQNENVRQRLSILSFHLCSAVSWCLLCPDKCLPVPDPDMIAPSSVLKGTFCVYRCPRCCDGSISLYFIVFIRPDFSEVLMYTMMINFPNNNSRRGNL